ncbi:MFS transporter [Acinetobacter sp. ANC 3791]|uniref:MFS transporter n=1 Tax=Acinetobacter sp. ANC 3791 TaxID=2529836 RepID=UPI00103EB1CF|nr:MFS transporter [Acinetobacter sp. ANC 3791]TCB82797.1 MFS transporter [Acinetobacter sp. ANC 3791]
MQKFNVSESTYRYGIRENLAQFAYQLLQVFLVGLTIGMFRTVVPALAEDEFGVSKGSFMLLTAFVVAFGFVKGTLNFVAGRWSERVGRKKVLIFGWLIAVPIPFLIFFASSWNWIVAATILLGVNQGLCWSMTQTSKMDMTRADERGLTMGLNEFSGYIGVALAGILTSYMALIWGARLGLLIFGSVVISLALILAFFLVKETQEWARTEAQQSLKQPKHQQSSKSLGNFPTHPTTAQMFHLMSWKDRRMAAFCQAGMVEKFVDALVWVFYPVFLHERGLSLNAIGWIVGIYGFVWGSTQLLTGKLSDHIGRMKPIVWGMWICGLGVGLMLIRDGMIWWSVSAAITGFGMALLYSNLGAAVADLSHPNWRGSAIGIYRFWRDLGYGVGALSFGVVAHFAGAVTAGFWFVSIAMLFSGTLVMLWGEETHPNIH